MAKDIKLDQLEILGKLTIGLIVLAIAIEGLYLLASIGVVSLYTFLEIFYIPFLNMSGSGLLFFIGAIAYFLWLFRAFKNLEGMELEIKIKPIWAVVSHFVPIINLFQPFKNMRYLYVASLSRARILSGERTADVSAPRTILLWWLLLLAQRIVLPFLFARSIFLTPWAWALNSVLFILSGVFLIQFIREINAAQAKDIEFANSTISGDDLQSGSSEEYF